MNKRIKLGLAVAFLAFSVCVVISASNVALSETATETPVGVVPIPIKTEVSAAETKKFEIAQFLQVAINPSEARRAQAVYNINYVTTLPNENFLARILAAYPWLKEVLRDKGEPKFSVVNKWSNKPITVSFDLPATSKKWSEDDKSTNGIQDTKPTYISTSQPNDPKVEAIIIDQLNLVFPKISKITNLKLSYVSPPQQKEKDTAKLRIILLPNLGGSMEHSKFKLLHHPPSVMNFAKIRYSFFDGLVWGYMPQSVFFSPSVDNQVYGYIIPDSKNNIQMAFCYIWPGHEEKVLRGLVNECVLRSLGLTNTIGERDFSFLSLWGEETERNRANRQALLSSTSELPPLDEKNLRILYSDKIHAGDDYIQVNDALK